MSLPSSDMDEFPKIHTNHLTDLNGQIVEKTTTGMSTATSASVLNNANHARIKNSSFSITINTVHFSAFHMVFAFVFVFLTLVYSPVGHITWWRSVHAGVDLTSETVHGAPSLASLDLLHKWAAPNAILNTGGHADEVKLHPGTRQEVICLIEIFMDAQNESIQRILWLSGPAGAGKTAIMQNIAERCEERGVPHANFFFFRADSSRSHAVPLVATLMHQIIQIYPSVGNAVAAALASNPLLFQMGLRQQFDTLMHLPFTVMHHSSFTHHPIVLLIDGLDECDSEGKTAQGQILQALDALLSQKGVSFRVVVASRVEPQIAMIFKQLNSQIDSIFLDEQYSPEKDIRLFVTAQFNKIKSTHFLAHTLDAEWPSESDVDDIVKKSSGQFIYAATVMRFITHSSSSPIFSLRKVQGIMPLAKNSPFAHLDAVYTYILEQADDSDAVVSVLASKLVALDNNVTTIKACLKAYRPQYFEWMLDSYIAELIPIAEIRCGVLRFFHASFTDFLQDESRAGKFYIDTKAVCAALYNTADWRQTVGQ